MAINNYLTIYCCILLKLQILIIIFQYEYNIPFTVIKEFILDNPEQIKQLICV